MYQWEDYVIRFLKGLNEHFSQVRSQIMLMETLPSINKTFSLVVQQKRQMNLTENGEIKMLVAKTTTVNFTKRNAGERSVCIYCGKTGHTINKCYKKYGYPPGMNPTTRQKNEILNLNNYSTEKGVHLKEHEDQFDCRFTKEQYAKLVALIQTQIAQLDGGDQSDDKLQAPTITSGHSPLEDDWCR